MKSVNRKKAIFLDIDGTLSIPGCNEVPESALKAIKMAQAKGNYVLLCTGRNYNMLSPLLKYDFDGLVGSSGGYVELLGEVLYNNPMSKEQQEIILSSLDRHGIYYTIECYEGAFTTDGFKDYLERIGEESGNSEVLRWRRQLESDLNILSMNCYQGTPIYKIIAMSPSKEALYQSYEDYKEEFSICVQDAVGKGYTDGEILKKAFNKGTGVKLVCEKLGIPLSDAYGFGDSMNDLEMIEVVGHGICMANGSPALKELSEYVCPAVDEDGLYQAFEHYGLF